MGQYRFAVPEGDRFDTDSLVAAQIIGLEGIPWPGKTSLNGQVLTITRNTSVSGRLLLPFQTSGHGELALTTGTLPETDVTYQLDLELARGTLSRLRNQVSNWAEGGLRISDDFQIRLGNVISLYSGAVFCNDNPLERTAICNRVIDSSVELMFEVTEEFNRQIAAIHRSQSQPVPIIAGTVLEQAGNPDHPELESLSIQRMHQPAAEPGDGGGIEWDLSGTDDLVEWVSSPKANSVRIAGPFLQFDNATLPSWIPEQGSFEDRLDTVRTACRIFGNRYQNRLKILHVASGISGVGHQHFNYPQQLQLTLEMLETLDQAMPNTSMMVSFDQPWGERLSMATGGTPAMEIADALLRYGARISAFGLEFNLGYWPQGSLIRDPMQWVDIVDRWSQFGLPLAIYLSAPTGDVATAESSRFTQTIRGTLTRNYLETVFNLLVRRPSVNVVAWRRALDSDNRRFPISGLVDEQGNIKEVYDWFSTMVEDVK